MVRVLGSSAGLMDVFASSSPRWPKPRRAPHMHIENIEAAGVVLEG
jgi:hypothetical protein